MGLPSIGGQNPIWVNPEQETKVDRESSLQKQEGGEMRERSVSIHGGSSPRVGHLEKEDMTETPHFETSKIEIQSPKGEGKVALKTKSLSGSEEKEKKIDNPSGQSNEKAGLQMLEGMIQMTLPEGQKALRELEESLSSDLPLHKQLRCTESEAKEIGEKLEQREIAILTKYGHGVDLAKEYIRLNITITEDTVVKHCVDGNLDGKMTELGSGNVNKFVYLGKYRIGNDTTYEGVFKPEPSSFSGGNAAQLSGIDAIKDPHLGNRNIATSKVAQLLKFDVIPHSQYGMHEGKLGLVMDKAIGKPAIVEQLKTYKRVGENFERTDKSLGISYDGTNPSARREVMKLQLVDALTGQVDRHWGNYFVHVDEKGQAKVTGIDNDFSFGSKINDPNDVRFDLGYKYSNNRGVRLPPIVDAEMFNTIMGLKEEDLREALEGLLQPDEIDAAVSRLAVMKSHFETLNEKKLVIFPAEWGSEKVTALMSPQNSYIARDMKSN